MARVLRHNHGHGVYYLQNISHDPNFGQKCVQEVIKPSYFKGPKYLVSSYEPS